jgi:hypothetical protein
MSEAGRFNFADHDVDGDAMTAAIRWHSRR